MYLSKIELELSNPGYRAAVTDSQKMHQLISCLSDFKETDNNILYRARLLGNKIVLYLYSSNPLCEAKLLPGMALTGRKDVTEWLDHFEQAQILNFDLLTMPFKKISVAGSRNSRRRVLKTQEERFAWLERKAAQNGFQIIHVQENPYDNLTAKHPDEKGGRLFIDVYHYTGVLQIINKELFCQAIQKGIGPGKAYGLGMILLKW